MKIGKVYNTFGFNLLLKKEKDNKLVLINNFFQINKVLMQIVFCMLATIEHYF